MDRLKFRTFWLGTGYGLVAFVVIISLIPAPPAVAAPFSDKVFHLLVYGILMLWFAQLYPRTRYATLAICFIGLGIILEVIQAFSGYRSGEFLDAAANSFGVFSAWGLAIRGCDRLFHKIEQLSQKPRGE